MREDVRRRLIEVARNGKRITYGELMRTFGLARGRHIGKVLKEICLHEVSNNRPPLASIVVLQNSNYPSTGFLSVFPERYSGLDRNSPKARQLMREDQERTWAYWKTASLHKSDLKTKPSLGKAYIPARYNMLLHYNT
jgi:hypothetical protein